MAWLKKKRKKGFSEPVFAPDPGSPTPQATGRMGMREEGQGWWAAASGARARMSQGRLVNIPTAGYCPKSGDKPTHPYPTGGVEGKDFRTMRFPREEKRTPRDREVDGG